MRISDWSSDVCSSDLIVCVRGRGGWAANNNEVRVMAESSTSPDAGAEGGSRRDFLYLATGAVGAVGAASFVWPLIDSMNPSADVLVLASIEVDISSIAAGQGITVKWRGKPVFIRHRTPKAIEEARSTPIAELRDPQKIGRAHVGTPYTTA